ncbi:phage holin family protein [Paenibacillus sp. GP183]|uniref:phage holin family protein n=1 Tax=Paenibacillus sp. GP183 TaxID=1882751 RepID=UPI0008977EF3|nr:phage holin family protein [Paenibacillus sp. GP183]SEB92131.1 4 TMS phage holin, superfamily IV [Paenibacillus sp. GP183]
MRNILNILVTFFVFWFGSQYFNQYISISDTKTLILATVLMFVISFIYGFLLTVSMISIVIGIGCLTTPLLVVASLVLTPIKLWLLNKYLTGFEIHGFWTFVILTIVLSIFTVKVKSKKD